jgi:hypothetical protein
VTDAGPYKRVEVEWIDSKGITGEWEFKDQLQPYRPVRCRTVGFVIRRTPKFITLAMGMSKDQIIGRFTIPSRSIVKVRKLR